MNASAAPAQRREPPPLTDLRVAGDQMLDGVAVTSYKFIVREGGKFEGLFKCTWPRKRAYRCGFR